MTQKQDNNSPKMSRRAIREAVFKLLFMSEFNSETDMKEQMALYFDGDCTDDEKIDPSGEDAKEINNKYSCITDRLQEIDELIEKTSTGWKLNRMSKVDLAILRLAVYEALYDEDIPVGVAVNEAVVIAKKFGGEDSGAFINGILGKLVKEKRN